MLDPAMLAHLWQTSCHGVGNATLSVGCQPIVPRPRRRLHSRLSWSAAHTESRRCITFWIVHNVMVSWSRSGLLRHSNGRHNGFVKGLSSVQAEGRCSLPSQMAHYSLVQAMTVGLTQKADGCMACCQDCADVTLRSTLHGNCWCVGAR